MTKEDLDLIVEWFAHIEQIADDRKTLNGAVMEDWAALDEIKCKAKNCQEYIKAHCYEPSLPSELDEAAEEYADDNCEERMGVLDLKVAFKAGAEWMAGQGVSWEDKMTYYDGFLIYAEDERAHTMEGKFKEGDKVIVQIRKK